MIYGLGVSFTNVNDEVWDKILSYPNAVVHLIAGYHSRDVFEYFANKGAKILILGYKNWGRGEDYFKNYSNQIKVRMRELKEILPTLFTKCKVVSFDNLAIDQLNVRRLMSDDEWNEFYMGDDGTMTYYIDMVERKFARSSTAAFDKRYDLLDSVDDMFQKILSE